MKRRGKSRADEAFLKALGKNIERLIEKQGFSSPYDFWIKEAGDEVSRSALNYILTGRTDPKASTLRALARLLKVRPRDILDFES